MAVPVYHVFHEFKDEMPPSFKCPITGKIMKHAVIDRDGNSYDKDAIEAWLRAGNRVSPITGHPMKIEDLKQNRALNDAIEEYIQGKANGMPITYTTQHPPINENAIFSEIQRKLGSQLLTEKQKEQIRIVYTAGGIAADFREKIAIARCCWVEDADFRLRVYGEFAQFLSPDVSFRHLGYLPNQQKANAEAAYLYVLTYKPYLKNKLEIINEAITQYTRSHAINPRDSHQMQVIERDRARRFR